MSQQSNVIGSPIGARVPCVFVPVRDMKRAVHFYCGMLSIAVPENEDLDKETIVTLPMTNGIGLILDSNNPDGPGSSKHPMCMFYTSDAGASHDFLKERGLKAAARRWTGQGPSLEAGTPLSLGDIQRAGRVSFFDFTDSEGNLQMVCHEAPAANVKTDAGTLAGRVAGITCLWIPVSNLAASFKWYSTMLGLEVVRGPKTFEDGGSNALLRFGPDGPGIFLTPADSVMPLHFDHKGRRTSMIEFRADDIDVMHRRLVVNGVSVPGDIDVSSCGKTFRIIDPDGNQITIYGDPQNVTDSEGNLQMICHEAPAANVNSNAGQLAGRETDDADVNGYCGLRFPVTDLKKSIDYYCNVLGFKLNAANFEFGEANVALKNGNGPGIYLMRTTPEDVTQLKFVFPRRVWSTSSTGQVPMVELQTNDLRALHERVKQAGSRIDKEPAFTPDDFGYFTFYDPDGHFIRAVEEGSGTGSERGRSRGE